MPMLDLSRVRERMVERHLAGRGIRDQRVLQAMRSVPREAFVEPGSEAFAYEDSPMPIGEHQTISQPYIVAFMIQAAEISPGDRVLEVGAGSGYAAAVIGRIASHVYGIERHESLGKKAAERFADLGYDNIEIRVGDGTLGWPEQAPFDAILVSAGAPDVPRALREQLATGGRLVIPVGGMGTYQTLVRIRRRSETEYDEEKLASVRFVPLIGAQGWARDGRRAADSETQAAHGTAAHRK